jgi:membrane-bound lytic murein transglycosylase MltF
MNKSMYDLTEEEQQQFQDDVFFEFVSNHFKELTKGMDRKTTLSFLKSFRKSLDNCIELLEKHVDYIDWM